MDGTYLEMSLRLLAALALGGLVGLERSYQGRPAGFRTHALVCLSTALLMMVTVYEDWWLAQLGNARAVIDPTRMAQGIMTGIGFIGAGAIIKEGMSVRGLTTAASIWITASIGILMGIGFYFPAVLATLLTLGTLSVFRRIELRMPTEFHARLHVRFGHEAAMQEDALRQLVGSHGFTIANLDYCFSAREGHIEYSMSVRSRRAQSARALGDALTRIPAMIEFRLSPTGD
jgi:putative Mg2+ transporter-C (MgtC) family protein